MRALASSLRMLENDTVANSSATNLTKSGAQSGGELDELYMGIADKYGQIIGISNSEKLKVEID